MKKHVALIGKARSGKDSVAGVLTRHAAYTRLAFADKLKEAALRVDPIVVTDDDYWGTPGDRLREVVADWGWEQAKDRIPEVRRFLQHYGQTIRELDPEFWVRPVVDQVRQGTRLNMPCVVTDVRYRNEVAALKAGGALVVRVERPGAGLTGDAANHSSETELDDVAPDAVLGNTGTLDDLKAAVGALIITHIGV